MESQFWAAPICGTVRPSAVDASLVVGALCVGVVCQATTAAASLASPTVFLGVTKTLASCASTNGGGIWVNGDDDVAKVKRVGEVASGEYNLHGA